MKMIPVFIILFFISSVCAKTNLEERSFKVKPGGNVNLKLNSADIIINTWNRNEIQVNTSQDDGLKISQNNNTVGISSSGTSVPASLMINIPETFNISVKNTAGNVKLNGDLKGNLEVKNQGGNVSFNDINGNVSINTGGGNIKGSNISGKAEVISYGGDIFLGVIKGSTSMETGGGNIKIAGADKIGLVKTSGGNIMIKTAAGNGSVYTGAGNIDIILASGNLSIYSSGGNIRIDESKGSADVKTGGGMIRIKSLKGSINAHAESGDISINFTSETNKSEIISGNGDIRINVSPNLKAKITAQAFDPDWWKDEESNNNSIRSDFKVTSLKTDKREQQVQAIFNLNGGGTPIKIQTGHGTISIRKN